MPIKCNKCDSTKIVVVEYDPVSQHCAWDGWSEVMCLNCGHRVGRWSGKTLEKGEHEPYRGKHNKNCPMS